MGYKVSFREEIIRRALSNEGGETIKAISEETGVATRTIGRWLKIYNKNIKTTLKLQKACKIKAFLETLNMDFETKSRYCRTHGIYIEELNV